MKNKSKSIPPEEFFKKVALNSGVNDLQSVRDIFYGVVRTITQELRGDRRAVILPDWGEFSLIIYPERNSLDINDGIVKRLPAKPVVKFKPDYKVKKYFYALGEEGTVV
jgi:nucleoid DNA-binding protein